MKKNKFLFVIAFAMLILLPFRVNAMSLNAYDYDGNEKIIEVESSDTIEAVKEKGLLGAFTGGLTATAGGIAAAVIFA